MSALKDISTAEKIENDGDMSRKERIDSVLSDLYYSLREPSSFSSESKLFKAARLKIPFLERAEVKNWLMKNITYTLHKPVKVNISKSTRPVVVYEIDEQWQADLVDMSKISRQNKGFKFLLVCIDVLSKYAWIRPLKSKHGINIRNALKNIFESDGRVPKILQTDKGSEFFNSLVTQLLRKHNVKLITTFSERKASVVERLNRTMKSIMFRYFTHNSTRVYINVLEDLTHKYNHSLHRMLKMKPVDVNKTNELQVWLNLYEKRLYGNNNYNKKLVSRKRKTKLEVGDLVRLAIETLPFRKGYLPTWTEELFKIRAVLKTRPITFKVSDQSGEDIKGTFYESEIQKVLEPKVYRIERVIRKKKSRDGKVFFLVKWAGYPDKFNSFVSADDLVNIQ